MNQLQVHRGPDEGELYTEPGRRFWSSSSFHYGCFQRTAAAVQRGWHVVVVFNGEIYNFEELAKELSARGPRVPYRIAIQK